MAWVITHALYIGGISAIVYGCWAIYHPAGYIVGGAASIWVSFLSVAPDPTDKGKGSGIRRVPL